MGIWGSGGAAPVLKQETIYSLRFARSVSVSETNRYPLDNIQSVRNLEKKCDAYLLKG